MMSESEPVKLWKGSITKVTDTIRTSGTVADELSPSEVIVPLSLSWVHLNVG